jgi:hypothetical protein
MPKTSRLNKIIGIFRKEKKFRYPPVISILPALKESYDFLLNSQQNDGSWSNDLLTTSVALQALASFLNVMGNDPKLTDNIRRGAEFLLKTLDSEAERILKATDLYPALDKTAIEFGNALYTLYRINNIFLDKFYKAFLKIEDWITRFIEGLSNIEVACSILNCYTIQSFSGPPEQIFLKFAISQLFRGCSPRDAFLLMITLKNLEAKFSQLLEEEWRSSAKKINEWRNKSLDCALQELLISKTKEVLNDEKTDLPTLCYCLMSINRLGLKTFEEQGKVVEKLLDLFNKINIKRNEISEMDVALFVLALSESPFSKTVFFPATEKDYIIKAVKWFEAEEKIIMDKYGFLFLIFIGILGILLTIVAIQVSPTAIISLIFSYIIFIYSIFTKYWK